MAYSSLVIGILPALVKNLLVLALHWYLSRIVLIREKHMVCVIGVVDNKGSIFGGSKCTIILPCCVSYQL